MKKYKVTQEFMEELGAWQNMLEGNVVSINEFYFDETIRNVENWRSNYVSQSERNQRFGAIINWINGEDVFEVGKTHKFGVRSVNHYHGGNLWLRVRFFENGGGLPSYNNLLLDATLFAERDEAELWTTNGFEVVEVDE